MPLPLKGARGVQRALRELLVGQGGGPTVLCEALRGALGEGHGRKPKGV